MDDLPETVNGLASRLEMLEQRVYALEHPVAAMSEMAAPEAAPSAAVESREIPSTSVAGGVFSMLGRAMLGIAGAYLLRAVAESNALPGAAVAAVAIAYALAWLVWASRMKAGEWLAGTTYACTSALILAPMLWELTLRFKVLPAAATAVVVAAFVVAASALAWKRNFAPVLWVANGTSVAIALALAIASHQMMPFIAVLLLMVAISEYGRERGRDGGVRVLAALGADTAIWALLYIYNGPENTRANYPALDATALIAPGLGLLAIVGAAVIYRTGLKGRTITIFEMVETVIAFLLAAWGWVAFGPEWSRAALGIFCVVCSLAGYVAAFALRDRGEARRRSLVFANWSAALLLGGCLLWMPAVWQAVALGAAAIGAAITARRLARLILESHALAFLLAAAWISGLLQDMLNGLAGALPGAPGWGVCVASACAVVCYAALRPCRDKTWQRQVVELVFAAVALGSVVALAVEGLVGLMALVSIPEAHHVAFIRTLMICAAAIALAFSGWHWRRQELTRIGYATLGLLAVKLVAEDLRHGHLAYVAAAIFLFAVTLLVVPRVARMGQRV